MSPYEGYKVSAGRSCITAGKAPFEQFEQNSTNHCKQICLLTSTSCLHAMSICKWLMDSIYRCLSSSA